MTLSEFLRELDSRRVSYRLDRVREAIMVVVFVPGQHCEVEFMDGGGIEVERFRSDGHIGDESLFAELWPMTE